MSGPNASVAKRLSDAQKNGLSAGAAEAAYWISQPGQGGVLVGVLALDTAEHR
jgi:hypothetical protein